MHSRRKLYVKLATALIEILQARTLQSRVMSSWTRV